MEKTILLSFLKTLACDDTQFCLHNWTDDDIFFNLSLTNDEEETAELLLCKSSGLISINGYVTYKMLETINALDLFLKTAFHAEYRKDSQI